MTKLLAAALGGLLVSGAVFAQPDLDAATRQVEADGTLAHSTGPVRDSSGLAVARFNSVWRLEAPGVWRVVFDKGETWEEPQKP